VDGGAAVGGNGAAGGSGGAPNGVVVGGPDGYQEISTFDAPPEATRKPGVPKATLDTFVYTSPTIFGAGQSGPVARDVAIFIPAQYVPNAEVPFIVLHDGNEQLNAFHTDIVLENLIYEKKLPVMAALFVNRPNSNDFRQRSLEYDCIDADYSEYMIKEIIPAVKARHPELNLTDDPNGRATLGKSSGAPAAFTMAWLRPDLYRRVVTFNGSFMDLCSDGPGADVYPDMIRAAEPAKPLRLYLFSGSNDNAGQAPSNQKMADAFKARGLPWRYDYGIGAAHANNYGASRVVEALLWIWAGYPL
jgi:enterochelin esterase-like enzyme